MFEMAAKRIAASTAILVVSGIGYAQKLTTEYVRAQYSVPVERELRDAAVFDTDYRLKRDMAGNLVAIEYDLPTVLVPEGRGYVALAVQEPALGPLQIFQSAADYAACSIAEDRILCFVRYLGLDYDLTDHLRELSSRLPVDQFLRAESVARLFAADPEGLIEIWLER